MGTGELPPDRKPKGAVSVSARRNYDQRRCGLWASMPKQKQNVTGKWQTEQNKTK